MTQTKFETINFKRSPVLYFKINGDQYKQVSIETDLGFREHFAKNNKYCLTSIKGKYILWDIEKEEVLGEYGLLIAMEDFRENFIDASIEGFNILNSLLGDEPITDGNIEVWVENPDFLESVKDDYLKEGGELND